MLWGKGLGGGEGLGRRWVGGVGMRVIVEKGRMGGVME